MGSEHGDGTYVLTLAGAQAVDTGLSLRRHRSVCGSACLLRYCDVYCIVVVYDYSRGRWLEYLHAVAKFIYAGIDVMCLCLH